MNRILLDTDKTELEAMIDFAGLASVLLAIADICGQKAEHVATQWQDTALAKRWDRAERIVSSTIVTLDNNL